MKDIFSLPVVPVLQNRVYANRSDALGAPTGSLRVSYCEKRRIGVNEAFDPELITYDENYNNDVPSAVFLEYLHTVARSLALRYDLNQPGRRVAEIGCGDGKFLQILAEICPLLELIGIDPSYVGPETLADERIRLISDELKSEHLSENISLIICRHTLEHIWRPEDFLQVISANAPAGIAAYFEVPSLEWTVEQGAFWDMCYEHCNYFTESGFAQMIDSNGFERCLVERAFDNQYLGAHAVTVASRSEAKPKVDNAEEWVPDSLLSMYDRILDGVEELGRERDVVVWGMATKGVMLALGIEKRQISIAAWVDVNTQKQGHHVPVTGYRIDPPEVLAGRDLDIICMNPNYIAEVAEQARALGVSGTVFSPDRLIKIAL